MSIRLSTDGRSRKLIAGLRLFDLACEVGYDALDIRANRGKSTDYRERD